MFFKLIPQSVKGDKGTIPTSLPPAVYIFIATVLFRLVIARDVTGYKGDLRLFMFWANELAENGLNNFYYGDFFKDYAPVYMYVLYIMGTIAKILNLEIYSSGYTYFIKFAPIFFDGIISVLIYFIGRKSLNFSANKASIFALIYAFNPAIIYDSSIWGQVDIFHTMIIGISLFLLYYKKYTMAYILYVIAILTKQQSLIFGPIYLFSILNYFKENDIKNNVKFFFKHFCVSIAIVFIVCFPFVKNWDFKIILDTYIGTIDSYSYATLNAFNFHGFLGGNFIDINEKLFFISYKTFGHFMLVVVTVLALFYLYKNRTLSGLFFIGGFLNAWTFMFSIKMHERYLYPSLLMFLLAYMFNRRKEIIILFISFSITLYINCTDVVRMMMLDNNTEILKYSMFVISFINIILTFFMVYYYFISFNFKDITLEEKEEHVEKFTVAIKAITIYEKVFFSKKDLLIATALTTLATVLGFSFLGSNVNPQKPYIGNKGDYIDFNFQEEEEIKYIRTFLESKNNKNLQYSYKADEKEITIDSNLSSVFKWNDLEVNGKTKKLRLNILDGDTRIMELAFIDELNNIIPIEYAISSNGNNYIHDEQNTVPQGKINIGGIYTLEMAEVNNNYNYTNSTYFDEIYHPRTGYEIVNNLTIYETTHPPLGKDFMALSIYLLNMSPFAYRLPGVICGILMIPALYLLAYKIFKNRFWALFPALLFLFDFMHFSQTRIGTIDTYVTLFIIISYIFMYQYYEMNFYKDKFKDTLKPLFWCGIFMGLSIASKWTGVYSALGLAIIFFYTLGTRYKEYLYLYNENGQCHEGQGKILKTIGFCFLVFVFIPLIIYGVSYIPILATDSWSGIGDIIKNQNSMLSYHSNLETTHPFESSWWMWPLNIRPVYYYSKTFTENIVAGISGFGNPVLWWSGLGATIYVLFNFKSYKKIERRILFFILIAYSAQYLPWITITRTTYLYHYFPSTPFVMLLLAFVFKNMFNVEDLVKKRYAVIFVGIVGIVFFIYYPVLVGLPVNKSYADVLKILPTWVLTP
ncbi:MAG: phospholipid carrier-dependent glycosyltransferase [Lachnospirales bacterium]